MTPAKTPQFDNDPLLGLAAQLLLRVEQSDKNVLPRKIGNRQLIQESTQLKRHSVDKRYESFPPDQTSPKAEPETRASEPAPSLRAGNPAQFRIVGTVLIAQTGCPTAYRGGAALIGCLMHRSGEYSGLCGCPIALEHYTPSQTSISGARIFE